MGSNGPDERRFSVSQQQRGATKHVLFSGDLDTTTVAVSDEHLAGMGPMSVDLSRVTFMDSAGLHPFLRAAERSVIAGRAFTVVAASPRVRRLLAVTRSEHLLGTRIGAVHVMRRAAQPPVITPVM